MALRSLLILAFAGLLAFPALVVGKPEDELAATIKQFHAKSFTGDWMALDGLAGIQWAAPARMLQNCLPDGGCFTRQGVSAIGGRKIVVLATGARTIVSNLYLRNGAEPFGESAVLTALKSAGVAVDLARCPVPGTSGGTNWYKIKGAAVEPGVVAIQSSCNGKPCEGITLTRSADLPALQPAQLKMYSESCSGAPATRQAVTTVMPHEALADAIAKLIPLSTGAALEDWKTLPAGKAGIQWIGAAPAKTDLSYKNDPNPFSMSGTATLSGRKFSAQSSGTAAQPKTIYLEEMGMHPRGEHMLGALYKLGFTVQLARCGPVYTESTNNWYSVKSANTHPVMLQQSIRYEGNQVQDSYALRLDNTLPKRDPRDRDPGAAGCR